MLTSANVGQNNADPSTYDQLIYNEALSQGMPAVTAQLIVAQARYESGDYTDGQFVEYNNAFGFGYSTSSLNSPFQSGSDPSNPGFASYATIQDSVDNLVAWLNYHISNGDFALTDLATATGYATAIQSVGYSSTVTAAQYAAGLQSALADVSISTGPPLLLIGAALAAAIALLFIKW